MGVGCVPGEPGESPLRVIVIALVGKVAERSQMGKCSKWKEDGKCDEECVVCPHCANLPYKQDVCVVWGVLSLV